MKNVDNDNGGGSGDTRLSTSMKWARYEGEYNIG